MLIKQTVTGFNGFLFIGDPHLDSRRIGRRMDNCMESALGKLTEAAEICTEKRLYPVILGDLIHRSGESSMKLLNKLLRVLALFPATPICLGGNHGREQTALTDNDMESVLSEVKALILIEETGPIGKFDFQGQTVVLHGFPYFSTHEKQTPFKKRVEAVKGINIGISHEDLAFDSAYPTARKLAEIGNMQHMVNGHMHRTMKSIKVGETTWHNPGNIENLSVDLAEQKPAVWEYRPGMDLLEPHYLDNSTQQFDLTGRQVNAATSEQAVEANQTKVRETGAFAKSLKALTSASADATDDGEVLKEDVKTVLSASKASPVAQAVLNRLLGEVLS